MRLRWIPPGFTSTFSTCLDQPLYSCSSVSSPLLPGKGEWRNNLPTYVHVKLFQLLHQWDLLNCKVKTVTKAAELMTVKTLSTVRGGAVVERERERCEIKRIALPYKFIYVPGQYYSYVQLHSCQCNQLSFHLLSVWERAIDASMIFR